MYSAPSMSRVPMLLPVEPEPEPAARAGCAARAAHNTSRIRLIGTPKSCRQNGCPFKYVMFRNTCSGGGDQHDLCCAISPRACSCVGVFMRMAIDHTRGVISSHLLLCFWNKIRIGRWLFFFFIVCFVFAFASHIHKNMLRQFGCGLFCHHVSLCCAAPPFFHVTHTLADT